MLLRAVTESIHRVCTDPGRYASGKLQTLSGMIEEFEKVSAKQAEQVHMTIDFGLQEA